MTERRQLPPDIPTAAQVAQLIERVGNQAEDIKEMKASVAQISQALLIVTGMQRDLAHIDEKVRQLFAISDQRGPLLALQDKRVTALERWNKVLGTLALSCIGVVGWGVQRIEYLYQMDNRIAILELLVGGKQVEQVFGAPRSSEPK